METNTTTQSSSTTGLRSNTLSRHDQDSATLLQEAAKAAGVKLDLATAAHVTANGASAIVAATADLGSVHPDTFEKGIDVAFGFFNLPQGQRGASPPLPVGFYTVKITAPAKVITRSLKQNARKPLPDTRTVQGRPYANNGQASFVDASGRAIAQIPAAIGAWPVTAQAVKAGTRAVEIVGAMRNITVWRLFGDVITGDVYWVCWGNDWIDNAIE